MRENCFYILEFPTPLIIIKIIFILMGKVFSVQVGIVLHNLWDIRDMWVDKFSRDLEIKLWNKSETVRFRNYFALIIIFLFFLVCPGKRENFLIRRGFLKKMNGFLVWLQNLHPKKDREKIEQTKLEDPIHF